MKLVTLLILGLFGAAQYAALAIAPPDRMMGDVYRILYLHVPAAWTTMALFFINFVGSVGTLVRRKELWDRLASAAAEVGLVFNGLTLALGSIWGKPVWGGWWTWDPRLTTTALLFVMYGGYFIFRRLLREDPDRCSRLSATIGLFIFLNVPIVYLSVKWWRSLHQMQSSPETMDPSMVLPLRLNAIAFLAVALLFLSIRIRLKNKEGEVS